MLAEPVAKLLEDLKKIFKQEGIYGAREIQFNLLQVFQVCRSIYK